MTDAVEAHHIAAHIEGILRERLSPEDAAWAARRIFQDFGGDRVYFCTPEYIQRLTRAAAIMRARASGATRGDVAAQFGVSQRTVSRICAKMN